MVVFRVELQRPRGCPTKGFPIGARSEGSGDRLAGPGREACPTGSSGRRSREGCLAGAHFFKLTEVNCSVQNHQLWPTPPPSSPRRPAGAQPAGRGVTARAGAAEGAITTARALAPAVVAGRRMGNATAPTAMEGAPAIRRSRSAPSQLSRGSRASALTDHPRSRRASSLRRIPPGRKARPPAEALVGRSQPGRRPLGCSRPQTNARSCLGPARSFQSVLSASSDHPQECVAQEWGAWHEGRGTGGHILIQHSDVACPTGST